MLDFDITILNKGKYGIMIHSTSYQNPIDSIDEISCVLKSKYNYIGAVLFDLLLTHGLSFNRYVEGLFDGEKINYSSLRVVKDIDEEIQKQANQYYFNNRKLLNKGVLPKVDRFSFFKSNKQLV